MSAPTNSCRVKLHIKKSDNSAVHRLWYGVDFHKFRLVEDVVTDVVSKLDISGYHCETISMQDIEIPKWETSSLMFKDGDDLLLNLVPFEAQSSTYSQASHTKRKKRRRDTVPTDEDEVAENVVSDDADIVQLKPKKKKKKRDKPCGSPETVDEPFLNDETREVSDENEQPASPPIAETTEDTISLCELSSVDEEEDDVPIYKPKKNREAALTPAELALLSVEIPKPKRVRKRHSKSNKLPKSTENVQEKQEELEVVHVSPLQCAFSGTKRLFDSDDNGDPEPVCETSHTKAKDESYSTGISQSKVEVTLKQPSVKLPQISPLVDRGLSSFGKSTPINSPLTCVDAASSGSVDSVGSLGSKISDNRTNTARRNSPRPAVYTRAKLRATVSPAVLAQLSVEAGRDHKLCHEDSKPESIPSADNSYCQQSVKGAKDDRKTHNQRCTFEKSKQQQLSDSQTNMSEVFECPSSSATKQSPAEEMGAHEQSSVNFSTLEVLRGPPRVGDKVAFKRLEISSDYTPVVSEFKSGVVTDFDSKSNTLHIKLHSSSVSGKKALNGKFDICIDNDSDDEMLTNVAHEEDSIVDALSSFMDLRLIPSLNGSCA